MHKLTLLLPVALAAVMLTGCVEEGPYRGEVAYHGGGGAYYDEGYDSGDVDFVYVESRPYSRYYGPLSYRNGGYYYSRGGQYYAYNRDHGSHRSHHSYADSGNYTRRSHSDSQDYISPQQRATNQAQIAQYRNQQAVQKYQNQQKIDQYRYQAHAQQSQNQQQLKYQQNQYAYQQKQKQYQQQQAIQRYQQTHQQPAKSKKKKKDE